MPVYNAQVIQRVTVWDKERTESKVVDRIVARLDGHIALDDAGAAAKVGRLIPATIDDDEAGQLMVRVQKIGA